MVSRFLCMQGILTKPLPGFEPGTFSLGGRHSNPLSYKGILQWNRRESNPRPQHTVITSLLAAWGRLDPPPPVGLRPTTYYFRGAADVTLPCYHHPFLFTRKDETRL